MKFVNPPSENKEWHKNFVVWPNLPVRVRVSSKTAMWKMLAIDSVRAVAAWNESIGCEVFSPSWEEDAEVIISMEPQPEGENWAGSARFVHRKNKKWGRYWGSDIHIYILYLGNQEYRDNVMRHELGHALGLDDLEGDTSMLMYESISPGTDVDKEVLKTLNRIYCGRE